MNDPVAAGSETVTLPGTPWVAQGRKIVGWAAKLLEFGLIQGLVQLLLAVAGLLIVRTLSKGDYALFAIANAIQVGCNALADLGIGIGVRSIGGVDWNDRKKFGELLHTALGLRQRFAVIAFAICLPLGAWMFLRNGASIPVTIALCILVGLAVIPLLGISAWGASAQFHGEYRRIQKLDFANAIVRLCLIGVFCFLWLNALLAFAAGLITNWIQMLFLRRWSRDKIDPTSGMNPDYRRELIRLSIKSLPNTIFFCLQGQITLLILTFTGNATGVADITALGRIAILFTVFSVTFSNILGPRFARCQDPKRIPRLYAILLLGTVAAIAPMVLMAALWPGPFLWLLGPKYGGLEKECIWVVAAACLAHIGNTMWNLNSSRAWIGVQATVYIPIMVLSQIIGVVMLDLTRFHDVLIFNLIVSGVPMVAFSGDALLGLSRLKADTSRAGPPL